MDHSFVTNEESLFGAVRAIHLGWKSVMLDGSLLPYEENIRLTKELARICRLAGVSCVGALGEVRRFFPQAMNYAGAFEESFIVPPEIMTDPGEARRFVEETGWILWLFRLGNMFVLYGTANCRRLSGPGASILPDLEKSEKK